MIYVGVSPWPLFISKVLQLPSGRISRNPLHSFLRSRKSSGFYNCACMLQLNNARDFCKKKTLHILNPPTKEYLVWMTKEGPNQARTENKGLHTALSDVSLRSPKIRPRKSSTIRGSPSLNETLGSHPSISFAFEMSGFLLWGSSEVLSWNSILAWGSITSFTTWKTKSR